MNKVTVVIPFTEAQSGTLEHAAKSAWDAGADDVIVVPDGMGTIGIIGKEYLAHLDNDIPYGVCAARNRGIQAAKQSSLILPLDADDYLLPGAVERMAAAWSPGKVVYGNWLNAYPDEDIGELMEFKQAPPPEMLPRKHVCHATYLFAKEDWQRVGGYDPIFNLGSEDHEFMIALVEAGCELIRLDGEPLYVKTMGGERTQKAIQRQPLIRQLLIEKHPAFFNR